MIGRLATSIDGGAPEDSIAYGSIADLRTQFGDAIGRYAGILCTDPPESENDFAVPAVYDAPNLGYLGPRDVVALDRTGRVYVLYRHASRNNTILMTEQCNSLCLMCSQPPRKVDDSYRLPLVLRLLELTDPGAAELVISGGEPTLFGDGFLDVVEKARTSLSSTALHVLTNGRLFARAELASRVAAIGHHDLMLGIPLYSDIDQIHDYVVQAAGAYDETIRGLYNLAKAGVRIELRVVLHKQTYRRLPQLAAFIGRNLPFVEQVALMGLEMTGLTPRNLGELWIDPVDYQPQLDEATNLLALSGMTVWIYNHQLCTLPKALWPYARKSISDWKNVYLPECEGCGAREQCGGFFHSATKRHSSHIHTLPSLRDDELQAIQSFQNASLGEPIS